MNFTKIAATAALLAFSASAAFAQAAAPAAPVAPKAPAAAVAPSAGAPAVTKGPALKKATTPEGQACSAQADAQNLHGKPRVKFRNKCIKDMKAAAAKGAAPAVKKN